MSKLVVGPTLHQVDDETGGDRIQRQSWSRTRVSVEAFDDPNGELFTNREQIVDWLHSQSVKNYVRVTATQTIVHRTIFK